MKLWLLTAALLGLALAGCGPDCDKYCAKMASCASAAALPTSFDQAKCVVGCNDSKADKPRTINCIIDQSCSDIAAGHCSPTGQANNP